MTREREDYTTLQQYWQELAARTPEGSPLAGVAYNSFYAGALAVRDLIQLMAQCRNPQQQANVLRALDTELSRFISEAEAINARMLAEEAGTEPMPGEPDGTVIEAPPHADPRADHRPYFEEHVLPLFMQVADMCRRGGVPLIAAFEMHRMPNQTALAHFLLPALDGSYPPSFLEGWQTVTGEPFTHAPTERVLH